MAPLLFVKHVERENHIVVKVTDLPIIYRPEHFVLIIYSYILTHMHIIIL